MDTSVLPVQSSGPRRSRAPTRTPIVRPRTKRIPRPVREILAQRAQVQRGVLRTAELAITPRAVHEMFEDGMREWEESVRGHENGPDVEALVAVRVGIAAREQQIGLVLDLELCGPYTSHASFPTNPARGARATCHGLYPYKRRIRGKPYIG